MRKNWIVAGALILLPLAACKVEKTGEDTYKVEAPTPEAKAAGQEAAADAREAGREISADAKEAGREIKADAKEVGKDVQAGAREATRKTGVAVEKAGKKMQKHAKPGDQ